MGSRLPSQWKRLSSGPMVDYKVFRVQKHRVADPRDGTEHERVLIDSPDWVNIIPLTPDRQVVMIRQFRFGIDANTLEIPGGMVEPGEEPMIAAARELEEETGYQPGRVVHLGTIHPNPAIQNNRCHSFLAFDCRKVHGGLQDTGEDISVELFDSS